LRLGPGAATLICSALFAWVNGLGAAAAVVQSPTPAPSSQLQKSTTANSSKTTVRHSAKARQKKAAEVQAAVEPVKPPAPPPPDWPVNDKAEAASVGWNGKDLSIAATNSSLAQILQDVSTATGVKVEGLGADQRVFGKYGPADARDVLAELLDGSGYNVMIIGDKGEGIPRQLVLTDKVKGASPVNGPTNQQNQNGDDDAVEEPEQPEQPPMQRPFGVPPQPGLGQRTPQQMMQELQQRQQQQLQNASPPAPPN